MNTHVHLPPNFSAFGSPEEAIERAAAEETAVVGTANYYDFGVYRRFAAAADRAGVVALFGMEIIALADELATMRINDPSNPGRMYLCGKGLAAFDPPGAVAADGLAAIRAATDERMRTMTRLVARRFSEAGLAATLSERDIAAVVAERTGVPVEWVSLQERHVAQAFQELLFDALEPAARPAALEALLGAAPRVEPDDPVAVQEALRSQLMKAGRPAFVAEASVSFEDAYALILELGGIPCYPILADGASPVCPFEDPPEALARRLLERGIHCAELIPGRNRPAVVDRYVGALREAGIVMLAGTEHNTQRMIPIAPAASGGEPLSARAREAFWEGTCVVVAHQERAASGRPGYVDRDGRLAGGFDDDETRIAAFCEAGAAIIAATAAARAEA